MSWVATRQTTRGEDMAYSLLGIFGVSMSLLYGEGVPAAFRRLQEEIIRTSNDLSIFAWNSPEQGRGSSEIGALATTVSQFANTSNIPVLASSPKTELTGGVIKVRLSLLTIRGRSYGTIKHYSRKGLCVYAIPLEEILPNIYVRLSGPVAVMLHSEFFTRNERNFSLVYRPEKYRGTATTLLAWASYHFAKIKSIPPDYHITAITSSHTGYGEGRRGVVPGMRFMINGTTWVEIRHVSDKNRVFVFPIRDTLCGKELLESRREEQVYPGHSWDTKLSSLEEFGNRMMERPLFTSFHRQGDSDDLRVRVDAVTYAAYEGNFQKRIEDVSMSEMAQRKSSFGWISHTQEKTLWLYK